MFTKAEILTNRLPQPSFDHVKNASSLETFKT